MTVIFSPAARAACVALALGAFFGGAGCKTVSEPAGRSRVEGAYEPGTGTLRSTVPANVGMHDVLAAGEEALMRRGYSITERTGAGGTGRVVGKTPERGLASVFARSMTVSARAARSGTRVTVYAEPLGDQAESRAVLDEVLALLGL